MNKCRCGAKPPFFQMIGGKPEMAFYRMIDGKKVKTSLCQKCLGDQERARHMNDRKREKSWTTRKP